MAIFFFWVTGLLKTHFQFLIFYSLIPSGCPLVGSAVLKGENRKIVALSSFSFCVVNVFFFMPRPQNRRSFVGLVLRYEVFFWCLGTCVWSSGCTAALICLLNVSLFLGGVTRASSSSHRPQRAKKRPARLCGSVRQKQKQKKA